MVIVARPARARKTIPDSELTGQKGENVVERIVLDMGFVWRSTGGKFDVGVDGRIELRDTRTAEPLHREVRVQSKGYAGFTRENADGFEFLCAPSDIDYWMRCPEPVILICSHPETHEVWYRCVTEWFADAQHRAARRVFFDKRSDRFDASAAGHLLQLAVSHEPTSPRLAAPPPEQLTTNLFPILEHSGVIWTAPTDLRTPDDVRARYEGVEGTWARDYLIRSKRLYALRDPRSCSLEHLCDTAQVEHFDAEDWSIAADRALRRNWTELLRRALLHQVRGQLRWHPKEHVFYFPAPTPLVDHAVAGPNGPRQVIKVAYYALKPDDREPRLKYVRHLAFRPGFEVVDGQWHLEVEPEYLFTYDGERRNFRADEYLAGIKKLDRNLAVLGHLRLWQHILSPPPSLLPTEPALLTIGPPRTVEVPVGLTDAAWGKAAAGQEPTDPNQNELAA